MSTLLHGAYPWMVISLGPLRFILQHRLRVRVRLGTTDLEYLHPDSGTTCPKLSLLYSEAHLVLDSWLEVPQKGVGFAVLQLPVLHWPTTQEVIQLCGEDGHCSTLILGTLVPCRKEAFVVKLSFSPFFSYSNCITSMLEDPIFHKSIKLFHISSANCSTLVSAVTLWYLWVRAGGFESHQPHLQQSRCVSCYYRQMAHNMDKTIP